MPTTKRARTPYRMVTKPTWELVRAAYLGGMTAEAVADRFGLGVHNVRRKIHDEGWSKRAYAEARQVTVDQGTPPAPRPKGRSRKTAPAPEETAAPEPDLIAQVLARAREALKTGRGAEATALLKAAREYVIVHQQVEDARAANAEAVAIWDAAQPGQAGRVTEPLLIQALHDQWSGLSAAEMAQRVDPDGKMGLLATVAAMERGKAR